MKNLQRGFLILTAFLTFAFTTPGALASTGSVDDEFYAKYQKRYAYKDTDTGVYCPTYLNYVGFTRYLARDGGVADGMQYTLHGGVSKQQVEDYIVYLRRFGYDVMLDACQEGVRFVEMRNVATPDYMPVNFRLYYDLQDRTLVTADPMSSEAAFERKIIVRERRFQQELNQPKALETGVRMALTQVHSVPAYEVDQLDPPACGEALPSLVERSIVLPMPTKLLADSSAVGTVTPPQDVNAREPDPYWLLCVTIDTAGTSLRLDDLEFCIGSGDVMIAYPLHRGASVTRDGEVPLLHTALPERMQGEGSLWLAFPGLSKQQNEPIRLYVSYARDRAPLLERVNFGFYANLTVTPTEIQPNP